MIPPKQYASLHAKMQAAATIAAGRLINVHADGAAVMVALEQVIVIVMRRTGFGPDALVPLMERVRARLDVDKTERRS